MSQCDKGGNETREDIFSGAPGDGFLCSKKGAREGAFLSFPGHSCLPVLPGPGAVP